MPGEIPFGQGMNGLAAYFAGQNAANATQRTQLDLASIAQQQERERQMLPLDVATKQATLPGIMGVSQQQAAAGQLAQNTLGDAIAAKMAKFKSEASVDQVRMLDATAEKVSKAAIAVKQAGLPAMAVPQAMQKVLSQYGLDESNPFAQSILRLPPDQMLDVAQQIGEGIAKANPGTIQNMAQAKQAQDSAASIAKLERESREKLERERNATQLDIANINSQSRIQAAQARQAVQKAMSSDQKIVALSSIPEEERTEDENRQLRALSQQRLAERAAAANALPAQMLDKSTPQQNAAQSSPFAGGRGAGVPPPVPSGMRQIGTSKGKPVYEDAQGNRFIGD